MWTLGPLTSGLQQALRLLPRHPVAVPRLLATASPATPGAAAAAAAAAGSSPPGALPWARVRNTTITRGGPGSGGAAPRPGDGRSFAAYGCGARWGSAALGGWGGGGGRRAELLQQQQQQQQHLGVMWGRARLAGAPSLAARPGCGPAAGPAAACSLQLLAARSGTMCAAATPGGWLELAGTHGRLRGPLSRGMSTQTAGSSRASGQHAEAREWWVGSAKGVFEVVRTATFMAIAGPLAYQVYYLVRHAERVPYSGRWQSLLPDAVDWAGEVCKKALDGYTSSGALLPPSHPDVQLVRRLGAAVVRAALEGLGGGAAAERLRGLRWEFNVVTDASKGDCYVTAGGKVWVSTHLLDNFDRDEDIVAGALAHEVSHVLAQHQAENITYFFLSLRLTCLWVIGTPGGWLPLWAVAAGTAALVGLAVHFARGSRGFIRPLRWYQEHEADAMGARIMTRAGFDPAAMVALHTLAHWADTLDGEPGLLAALAKVHPPSISRKTRAIEGLPELCKAYKEAGHGECEASKEYCQRIVDRIVAAHVKKWRQEEQRREQEQAQEQEHKQEQEQGQGQGQERRATAGEAPQLPRV